MKKYLKNRVEKMTDFDKKVAKNLAVVAGVCAVGLCVTCISATLMIVFFTFFLNAIIYHQPYL